MPHSFDQIDNSPTKPLHLARDGQNSSRSWHRAFDRVENGDLGDDEAAARINAFLGKRGPKVAHRAGEGER
jgi:hypothetical protein